MPTFTYTAHGRDGKKQKGTMTAESRQALTQLMQTRGLFLDSAEDVSKGGKPRSRLNKGVKTKDLLVFTRQLSTIVSAGLPLLQGLEILAEQTEDPNFAAVLLAAGQDVESGETFSAALGKYNKAFPDLYVSMVRAGEAGGDLDGVLLQLADYLESAEELKRRVKSAMTYPVVAFSIIILIAGGLVIFVVPLFEGMFKEMGAKLPVPTQMLLDFSRAVRTRWSLVVVGALIAAYTALKMSGILSRPAVRYAIDKYKLRLPIFGMILRKVAISRFAKTLSTLTKSGVAILQALEIVERTAGNEVFARVVREAGGSVRNGETLADPLARSEQFPPMVTRMIAVGEKTGALEGMLMKIGEFYDSEVKAAVDSMTSLLEPILILMMGIVVGGMVVALFLPIITMAGNIK